MNAKPEQDPWLLQVFAVAALSAAARSSRSEQDDDVANSLIDVSPLSRDHQAVRVGSCYTGSRLLLLIGSLCALLLLMLACTPAVSQLLPRLASFRLSTTVERAWQQQRWSSQDTGSSEYLGRRRWKVPRFPVGPRGIVTDTDALDGIKRFADLVGDAANPSQVRDGLLKLKATAKRRRLGIDANRVANHHRDEETSEAYDMSQCVGTIYDLANYIGWTGLNIDALVHSCPPEDNDVSCAANIPGIIANVLWMIDLAAQIPAYCIQDHNETRGEECFVEMAYFVASGGDLAADGISIKGDCENTTDENATDTYPVHGGRRLFLEPKTAKLPASPRDMLSAQDIKDQAEEAHERSYNQGICSMAAMQFANDLVYTGIDIWQVGVECADLNPKSAPDVIDDCAGNIIGVISDFPAIMADVGDLVSSCPVTEPDHASCFADVSDLVSAVLGLGPWAATVEHSCNYNKTHDGLNKGAGLPPIVYPLHPQAVLR